MVDYGIVAIVYMSVLHALTQAIMLICTQFVANLARTHVKRNLICTDLTAPRAAFVAFINVYVASREGADGDRRV